MSKRTQTLQLRHFYLVVLDLRHIYSDLDLSRSYQTLLLSCLHQISFDKLTVHNLPGSKQQTDTVSWWRKLNI